MVHGLRMHGDIDYVIQNTDELISCIKHQEPNNWILLVDFGTLLARLYGNTEECVYQSIKFIEKASVLVPKSVTVNMELAHQYYLLKNYQKAVEIYKEVARIDDSATGALIGLIKCRIVEGDFNEEV